MIVAQSALNAQPARWHSRRGFTLIEVTIAIMVLAVALTVMLGDFMSSQRARTFAAEQANAQEVARSMLNRLLNAPTSLLGVAGVQWGVARHLVPGVPADSGSPPIVDDASADGLAALGIHTTPTGMDDLSVYVEYYRGLASIDPSSGNNTILLGVFDAFPAGSDPVVSIASFRDEAWLSARRLRSSAPPSIQVPPNTPVMVRVIVTWNKGRLQLEGSQKLELHGARLF